MALTWKLSDGTTIDDTGEVSGDSICADTLRSEARMAKAGMSVSSSWGPIPSEQNLEFGKPHLVDAWVSWHAKAYRLKVVERPDFEQPEYDYEEPELGPYEVFVH